MRETQKRPAGPSAGPRGRNLRITGEGTAGPGDYQRVSIIGNSVIEGSLSCQRLKVMGDFQVQGELKCIPQEMRVLGTLSVQGGAEVKAARVLGVFRVDGRFSGETLRITGELTGHGSVASETLQVFGALSVDGMVNADVIKIRMHGPSHLGEVVGSRMSIRPARVPYRSNGAHLTASVIEGDDLELTGVRATTVRGKRIVLGPGCRIEHLEYQETCKQHPKAVVLDKQRG